MSHEQIPQNVSGSVVPSPLTGALKALKPRQRNQHQTLITKHYDDIKQAIARGASLKDIRDALAQHGMKVSAATFHRLMRAEADRRGSASDTPATNAEVKA